MRAVLLTYPNGGIKSIVAPCGKWGCPNCAVYKMDLVTSHIKEASGGCDLFAGSITADYWEAARTKARREVAGYVGIKRHPLPGTPAGAVFLVSDVRLTGRAWGLKPVSLDAVAKSGLAQTVRRVDWCERWRPEEKPNRVTIGRVSVPPQWASEVYERAGFNPAAGRIPGVGAEEAAALLAEAADLVAKERGSHD